MVPELRQEYNRNFTEEKYQNFLNFLNNAFNSVVKYRVCETPVFVPKELKNRILEAGQDIIQVITRPDFMELTSGAVPAELNVPNEDEQTMFLVLDFGICKDDEGKLIPQLIEMQGFPSLYAWENYLSEAYKENFNIPSNYSAHFSGFDSVSYINFLKDCIVGDHNPENVILFEIEPEKQGTDIDFYATEFYLGVKTVCITKIIREGRNLYYINNGIKTQVKRIYNRVIFDEFQKRTDLVCQFNLTEDVDVEWAGHPNWFFRISKYTLPFIQSKYVPETTFLSDIDKIPDDLENYVLKPLFSFAGEGVIFNVTKEDIEKITNPANYLLQRKVKYEPVIESPDGGVKLEIRIMYLWKKGYAEPIPCINLIRMSKGDLIGVKFNKDKTWVGGSIAFFEN